MKVLLDARMTVGGTARYARELSRELRSLLPSSDVVVVDRGGSLQDRLLGAPFTPWGRQRVSAAAHRARADLIHGLHFELPSSGLPSVLTVQDLIPLIHPGSMPNPLKRAVFRSILARSLDFADIVIAPSRLTSVSVAELGFAIERIRVVPLWASSVFTPATPTEVLGSRGRFNGGQPYVGTIYSPKSHKNLSVLARIAPSLPLPVMAVGPPSSVPPPFTSVGSLSDDELRHFYVGSEVFVLPSLVEGFGLPVLEALSCGTKVVCGPDVGVLEFVSSPKVADVSDPRELEAAILESLESGSPSEPALHEALRRLTAEAAARQTLSIYREALK